MKEGDSKMKGDSKLEEGDSKIEELHVEVVAKPYQA